MPTANLKRMFPGQWLVFGFILLLAAAAYAAYGVNMVRWKDATDYGWRAMYDSGPHIVDEVFARGWQAGLRPGDRILFINGRSYDTFDELYFSLRRTEPGAVNEYTVLRDGETVELHITNGVIGFPTVIERSGPLYLVGVFYLFLGVLVYLMKPGARESRVFLLMAVILGISISYASPSGLMKPLWLFKFRQFIDILLPAPIIHLALIFPRKRPFMWNIRGAWSIPYLVPALIVLFFRPFSSTYWDPPAGLDMVNNLYLLSAVVFFILSTVSNFRRGVSHLVRIRSRMVFIGLFIGFFLPVLELLARRLWGLYIFADPVLSFALLLSAFPMCVGYAIARHNLFEIDTVVRKSFGYALSSAAVLAAYAALAAAVNVSFPDIDIARSRVFTALFAVAVVITFRPLHEKIQRLLDRHFYRVRVDYRDAMISISEELTSVLDLREVIVRIIHAAKDVMYIDTAGVIRILLQGEGYPALFMHEPLEKAGKHNTEPEIEEGCLEPDDPLVLLVVEGKAMVTRYDLAEDPKYTAVKDVCLKRLDSLRCAMALPLIFQDQVTGILLLGRKISGRIYVREDIDLLKTLASQGAIAIENAVRAERMKDEEVVRTNLARYLSPQVVDQVIRNEVALGLGGGRKSVAVLISDIRGFTDLTSSQPPDRLVSILNEYFTEMARIIFEHRGSLDKYVGDAIVAVFGSLVDLANPTASAVKTSIDMVDRMRELNRKWSAAYEGFSMEIGIGIDTGEVFLGNVGSPERMEFTVIGTAVNMASRLSELARPRQILLSVAAGEALGGEVGTQDFEPEEMKKIPGHPRILEVVK